MSRSNIVKCKDSDLCFITSHGGSQVIVHSITRWLFNKTSLSEEEKLIGHIIVGLFVFIVVQIAISDGYY